MRTGGLIVLALTACGTPPTPSLTKLETAEGQALMAKLAPYLDCLDAHSANVFRIADDFRLHASDDDYAPNVDARKCIGAIAGAATAAPSVPALEAAGTIFASALREVSDAIIVWRAAKPEQRSGLHARMKAAFTAFDAAQAKLTDEVDTRYRQEREARLARQEKAEGRTATYVTELVMFHAQDIVAFAATPLERSDRIDVALLHRRLRAFRDSVDELRGTEGLESDKEHRAAMLERMQAFAIAAEQLAIRVRDKVPLSDAERIMIAANNEAGVVGSPAALAHAYNKLVDAYFIN